MRLNAALMAMTLMLAGACTSSTASKPTYVATMSNAKEVPLPANVTTGAGTATFTLDGNNLTYSIVLTSALTGVATLSHIHVGASTVAGPVVKGFTIASVATGTLATGTIDLTMPASATVSGDSLKVLLNNGNAYVNVHTAANPGGEIRGQIVKQ